MAKNKFDKFANIEKAMAGADLQGEVKKPKGKIEMKQKKLSYPKEWDTIIEENHAGTVMSYLTMAIKNQLKQDGYI